jgi:hypothetical protein
MNDASLIAPPTGIKTWELKQYTTGFCEGGINDWPAQIQDQIFEALERLSDRVQLPVAIVQAYFDIDYGDPANGVPDKFFVRVIASEIVASYEPRNAAQELYAKFKQGKIIH